MSLSNIKKQILFNNLNNYNNFSNKYNFNIYDNLNTLNKNNKNIILHNLENQELNNIILKQEIINYTCEKKILSLEIFKKIVIYLFDRYTYKIGGNYFNFKKWKERTKIQNIVKDCFVFSNIIHKDYYTDSDTLFFLNNLLTLFNNITVNYKCVISSKYLERDNLYYVFFLFCIK